jgi:thymidylate synthase (FAD)
MKVVKQSWKYLDGSDDALSAVTKQIEQAARVCYKSEDKITDGSDEKIIRGLIKSGHEAMVEMASFGVVFTTNRGVTHEIVRHRLFSFAQESTRYCSYNNNKFGNEITVVLPSEFEYDQSSEDYLDWYDGCAHDEKVYFKRLANGVKAQCARANLPNSLKSDIVVYGNIREWRHFLRLRTEIGIAHPDIIQLTMPLLLDLQEKLPSLFEDITPYDLQGKAFTRHMEKYPNVKVSIVDDITKGKSANNKVVL